MPGPTLGSPRITCSVTTTKPISDTGFPYIAFDLIDDGIIIVIK